MNKLLSPLALSTRTLARTSLLAAFALFIGIRTLAADDELARAVYTSTNAAAGNEVLVFERAADGALDFVTRVSTGGLGTGGGLGNQGALALDRDGRRLFVVNAGSSEISSFAIRGLHLTLVDKVASGGTTPVSLTVHGDVLYVLNAEGNIAGFRIDHSGRLRPVLDSTQPLTSTAAGPAQIAFSPDGDTLVVTEKSTNKIDVYAVKDDVAQSPVFQNSHGTTPFGFAFDRRGHLIVSEAFGGAPNASALSSYDLDDDALALISGSVPTGQTAACWVAVTKNGRFAYTANTGSGSISGYRVARDGRLTLLTPGGRTAVTGDGSAPTDLALTGANRFLVSLSPGIGAIATFKVRADGMLVAAHSVDGIPASATGLAAQ